MHELVVSVLKVCFDDAINKTYIALIPKIGTHVSITQLRPVPLHNVIYKKITSLGLSY